MFFKVKPIITNLKESHCNFRRAKIIRKDMNFRQDEPERQCLELTLSVFKLDLKGRLERKIRNLDSKKISESLNLKNISNFFDLTIELIDGVIYM